MTEPGGELILYRSDDGASVVQLRASGGTVWLTRGEMAELYGTTPQNISQVVSRVLADGEVGEATRNSEFLVRAEAQDQRFKDPAVPPFSATETSSRYLSGNIFCYA
jgi:hypothetical protein